MSKPRFPEKILLAHGAGGRLTGELVQEGFLPLLSNDYLATLTDSALLPELPSGRPALSTDAFVVDPIAFPGGNLGHLSVCGTVNDLAVAGARPLWLTWGLIIEEGTDGALLESCVESAAAVAKEVGVSIIAGDTKVVPRGKGDRLFAVTSGLGVVAPELELGDRLIQPGDLIIASGPLGDHGATIMACRHKLDSAGLQSDCAPLWSMIETLLSAGIELHALHDPTRGGTAAISHEVAEKSGLQVVLDESDLPVRPEVRTVCDLLGLEPLNLACEGRALIWLPESAASRALEVLHSHPQGEQAVVIGRMQSRTESDLPVLIRTPYGVLRPVDLLSGEDMPRIC